MPQRALNVLLGITGLTAVVGLVLIGVNFRRAARTGPRWKRKLIGAGLALLAALGLASIEGCGPPFTCYLPVTPETRYTAFPRLKQLADEVEALEKQETAGTLDREVLRVRLRDVETTLADLDDEWAINEYPEAERPGARRLREEIHQKVLDMKVRLMDWPSESS